jgi:predicted nucleic acid-binding protein
LDDGKARRFAVGLDIKITGTLGVIVKAYKLKLIDSLEEVINRFREVGFRVPNNIEQELLRLA